MSVLRIAQTRWTYNEVEYLRRNIENGYTYQQIADQLGRSRSSVAGQWRRLQGHKDAPRKPKEKAKISLRRVDQVAELLAQGLAITDIAQMLGCTRNSVKCAFKKIKRELGWQAQ